MATRQQKWYAYQRILKQQRSAGASATFSDAALAAFAQYDTLGDGLTDAEKTAMAAYIDAEVEAGNQAKKDYETIFGLSGANALVDYIGGKVAINNGSTLSVSGASFAGAQWIQSGFIPSSDGVNFSLNDAQLTAYVKTNNTAGGTAVSVLGGNDVAAANTTGIRSSTTGEINSGVNGGIVVYAGDGQIQNDRFYEVLFDGTAARVYIDGTLAAGTNRTPSALLSKDVPIGRWISNVTPQSYFNGVISMVSFGAEMASHSDFNTNVRTLLTALGSI